MVNSIVEELFKLQEEEEKLMRDSLVKADGTSYIEHHAKAEAFHYARRIVGNMLRDAETELIGSLRKLSELRPWGIISKESEEE